MEITARALNRATLARQLLLGRESLGAMEAVRRMVALQAQQPASPYIALWNRLSGFDPAGLDAAVAGLQTVKATLMRLTLHMVHAEDYRPSVKPWNRRCAHPGSVTRVSGRPGSPPTTPTRWSRIC